MDSFWDQAVIMVHVVVHNTGRMGVTLASNNHTTQYLILSSDTSVQLNMRTDPGYINGILEMAPRGYVESNSEILHFPIRVSGVFTPRMLYQWLY